MNIQTLLTGILTFLNTTFIPFLLAMAGLVFIWGIVRYFVFEGGSGEGQEKGKSLATWGIAAFVVIVSLWGIVNLLVSSLGLDNQPITPDYMGGKM